MDIEKLLTVDLVPTLTDFLDDQMVFYECCLAAEMVGTPIKNVLELGVYRLIDEPNSQFPGQSTKTLFILDQKFKFDRFISLDIDDCTGTINNCKEWCRQHGFEPTPKHQFLQCGSLDMDIAKYFPEGIDLLFVDTSHDDERYPAAIGHPEAGGAGMTYREICHYAKHLSKHGKMFLHDTAHFYAPVQYGFNTAGAIERFIDENPEFYFIEHAKNVHGLGEIGRK